MSFFTSRESSWAAGVAVAALLMAPMALRAQDAGAAQARAATDAPAQATSTLSNTPTPKKKAKVAKEDQIQQSKDTKAEIKKEAKLQPEAKKDTLLPDGQLYNKAMAQIKTGHYDVARLDLQTLLNTYPNSEYQMRAKLAVADSWYHEGGTAALAQAEQEYTDFITFFPNVPEAAEAQMRVGDIYFKQMDVPDRDYTKALKAEEAYRTMLKQYPDAPPTLLKDVKQKLREVQEVMATREAELGAFYASHDNWNASLARYETVVSTYPLYSHIDDAYIGIGDGYEAEAKNIRAQTVCKPEPGPQPQCIGEAVKAALLAKYDGKAADAYRTVVLDHAAAPHVEDAKERLAEMNLPIPTPTKEQVAASEALEGSRAQYTMAKRLRVLLLHQPDTVTAAQLGDPLLDDPAATTAPQLIHEMVADYQEAADPKAAALAREKAQAAAAATSGSDGGQTAPVPVQATAPLAFEDVPTAGNSMGNGSVTTMQEAAPSNSSGGNTMGVEVISSGTKASNLPASTGAQDPNNGLTAVGPKDTGPLPAAEKPADAPDQVNQVAGQAQPAVDGQTAKKPALDKDDESSSKKKPKKGLDKLNPF